MFRKTTTTAILALIVSVGFFVPTANATTTNELPASTITISALVYNKDLVNVRGDKLWLTHGDGKYPSNIVINGNSWIPVWENENESSTFTMKKPSRFLPMNGQRMGLLFVSVKPTDAEVSVFEYPDEFNEWILTLTLDNTKNDKPSWIDIIISWKKEIEPAILPNHYVPTTKPSPTPVGLR